MTKRISVNFHDSNLNLLSVLTGHGGQSELTPSDGVNFLIKFVENNLSKPRFPRKSFYFLIDAFSQFDFEAMTKSIIEGQNSFQQEFLNFVAEFSEGYPDDVIGMKRDMLLSRLKNMSIWQLLTLYIAISCYLNDLPFGDIPKPSSFPTFGEWANRWSQNKISRDMGMTLEDLREYAESRGGKIISEAYVNKGHKYEWECRKGHRWLQSWSAEMTGIKKDESAGWCPVCRKEIRQKLKSMSQNDIEKALMNSGVL